MVESSLRKLGFLMASLLIIIAVMMLIGHLLAPMVDKRRGDIEKWATNLLGMPVTITHVDLSWFQYQPEISLDQVTVYNKITHQPAIVIQKVTILFSIPKSLWNWKLVPDGFIIAGTNLHVEQASTGEWKVRGFTALKQFEQKPLPGETKFAGMVGWLSMQPYLVLRDINVTYQGWAGQERFVTLRKLVFKNNGDHHRVFGRATLNQATPTAAEVRIQWKGNQPDLNSITGKAYLAVSDFSISQWLKEETWQGWQVKDGLVNAKIKLEWAQGRPQKIETAVLIERANLYSNYDKSQHKINRLSGNFAWIRDGNNQVVTGENILFYLPAHVWPITHFYFSSAGAGVSSAPNASSAAPNTSSAKLNTSSAKLNTSSAKLNTSSAKLNTSSAKLNTSSAKPNTSSAAPNTSSRGLSAGSSPTITMLDISYLNLEDIKSFLLSSSFLSQDQRQLLTSSKLKGDLQNLVVNSSTTLSDWRHTIFKANFNKISFDAIKKYPGIKNITGDINWNGTQGSIRLSSESTKFRYASIFSAPLQLDQLSGLLEWQQTKNNNWSLTISNMQLLNHDIAVNINGNLTIPGNGPIQSDIKANFTVIQARHITTYLPMQLFDADLRSWLSKAFLTGEVKAGQAVFHGNLMDFPFANNQGQFSISARVNNIDLNYASDWPIMRHVSGVLSFMGDKVTIDLDHAEIDHILIPQTHAEIPHLSGKEPSVISVNADHIQTNFSQALHFIRGSPLNKSIGKMFKGVTMQGDTQLQLGLTVPLGNPSQTQVAGKLSFDDAQLNASEWRFLLSHLKGEIQFTEDSVTSKPLTGVWLNNPLQLSLQTIATGKNKSLVRASFSNQINMKEVERWLKIPVTSLLTGSTALKGEADFSAESPMEIRLQSHLQGITVKLPDQYGKQAATIRKTILTLLADESDTTKIKISYGDLLTTAVSVRHQYNRYKLIGANLNLGKGDVAWPTSTGLTITGHFNELDWDQVKQYLNQSKNEKLPLTLRGINIQADVVQLLGQRLTKVDLSLTPKQNSWNINLSSAEVSGHLQIPTDFNRKGLMTVYFDKMNLSATQEKNNSIDIKSLPSISFVANQVIYDDIPLGKVAFKTSPTNNGLNIQYLHIISPRMDLQSRGDWVENNGASITHLRGKITSSNVTDLISSFGFDAHNFIAKQGNLNFNLSWNDAPYSPTLASLKGNASLNLGPGRVVDIGASNGAKMDIGRMLSIFSLQSIPRRLSLDFSDVFQKGYSFDAVKGDFNFQNGNAYTTNFHFEGPVARVDIDGRIGLKNKDYDFTLSVTAYVTGGLPIAAAVVGGPIAGIAALAVNTVIGSQVSKATTYYYSVTGPWNNPSWKAVQSK